MEGSTLYKELALDVLSWLLKTYSKKIVVDTVVIGYFTLTTIFYEESAQIGFSGLLRRVHGLRTPNEAFFHWNPELLGRQIGQINSGAFGVFLAELSAPILVQWVPFPCFPLFNHYFYKILSLYIHTPNIYLGLGLGFEFGP